MQAFNPYLPSYEYVPDGEPRVFGDRVYVYGSHDRFNGNDFCLNDYVCYSAPLDKLAEWKYEGVIYKASQDPRNVKGNMHMCAPDCVQGADGRFYIYYQLHMLTCTSVAVADSPVGPFEHYGYVKHQDGTPWGEKKGDVFAFDPGVLVDDGRVYCYVGFTPIGGFKLLMKMRGNNVENGVCLELDRDMMTVIDDEHITIPGQKMAKGTSFEKHPMFEASSPRKINGKYYLVYSSLLSHELCYAISDRPMDGYTYGGTIVSIGDVGIDGRDEAHALNSLGNTHGGMVEINGQWYIFYHRQTNKQKCARQGCAEKIEILADGSIPQVEMTSCGLNDGPLLGKGSYEARIACTLTAKQGVLKCTSTHEKDKEKLYPYFTQTGADREDNPDQYIANMKDGSEAGFKYFAMEGTSSIKISVKGQATGKMLVKAFKEKDWDNRTEIASIDITPSDNYQEFGANFEALNGIYGLTFTYIGEGAVDFKKFSLG